MNYLQLCQDLVSELGLAGGQGPSSVTGQRGELKNVTRWIAQSCLWIDNLWTDWKYHWCEYSGQLPANITIPTAAQFLVGRWDRESLWVDKNSTVPQRLRFMEWREYRSIHEVGAAIALRSRPNTFTVRPDATLRCYPTDTTPHTVTGEFWRQPFMLVNDTDVPLMPPQHHRVIVARAAIMYGNREDAPEIIAGFEAEYTDGLEKLQSDQAPSFQQERSSGQDVLLVGAIPGMED